MRVFQLYKQCQFTANDWDLTEKEDLEGMYDKDRVDAGQALTEAFNKAHAQSKTKEEIYEKVMCVAEKVGYGATDSAVRDILHAELEFAFAPHREGDIDIDLSECHQFLFSDLVCELIRAPAHRMCVKGIIQMLYISSHENLDAKIILHSYVNELRAKPSLADEIYFPEIVYQDLNDIFDI